MKQWDVVIIGAGVAGCSAAKLLSKECSVLLLDPNPLNKTCAGVLTADYTRRYKVERSCIERELKGIRLCYRDEGDVVLPYRDGAVEYSIDRRRFDELNFEQALSGGVEYLADAAVDLLERGDGVRIQTRGGVVQGGYALVASGASEFSQRIAPLKCLGYCVQQRIEGVVDDYFQMHFGYHRGYTWLAPKSTYSLVGSGSPDGYPVIPIHREHEAPLTRGVIPYSGPVSITATPRTALIGDAAGFVTPQEGEGIYYARRSAEIAVEVLLENMNERGALLEFDARWRREFSFTPRWLSRLLESTCVLEALVEELGENERLRWIAEALLTKKSITGAGYLRLLPALVKVGAVALKKYFAEG